LLWKAVEKGSRGRDCTQPTLNPYAPVRYTPPPSTQMHSRLCVE
jgi:hypothetical protein